MEPNETVNRGTMVRDVYGKRHEVLAQYGTSLHMYDGEWVHITKCFRVAE